MSNELRDVCGPHSCCLCNGDCDCPYSYVGCMGCSECEAAKEKGPTMSQRKPTALDAIILKHEVRATQHGSATRNEMMKLAAAARRELQVKTELCEAWVACGDWPSPEDGQRVRDARDAYRQWLAGQEKQA